MTYCETPPKLDDMEISHFTVDYYLIEQEQDIVIIIVCMCVIHDKSWYIMIPLLSYCIVVPL